MAASGGGSAQGGCLPSGGVFPRKEGCLPRVVSAKGGVCLVRCVHLPPAVDRMTDTCENITFPQLLSQTVITMQLNIKLHG